MARKRGAEPRHAGPSRRAWVNLTESGTRAWTPGDLGTASSVFESLPPEAQLAIAQEVVETRGGELSRAYPGVIDISFGFRRRRKGRRGRYGVVPMVCVRFMVKRKRPRREVAETVRIPSHLFTYCQVGSDRRLCAVPTDVEEASTFAGARAQADSLHVRWETSTFDGVATCALTRDGVAGMFGLSCRHVLSLTDFRHGERTWGADVSAGGAPLGHSTPIEGPLRIPPERSFDAQLMEVDSVATLRRALSAGVLDGFAAGPSEVPAEVLDLYHAGGLNRGTEGRLRVRPALLSGPDRQCGAPHADRE